MLLVVSGAALTDTAAALDRRVRIVNDSGQEIVAFYGAARGAPGADENRLAEALPPGGSAIVSFDDGSGYCRYNFRAVFGDGISLERSGINVCEVGTYRYTD